MADAMDQLETAVADMSLDFNLPSGKIRISKSKAAGAGRGLIATRDIGAHEEVFCSQPIVLNVEEGLEHQVCDWCHILAEDINRVDTGGEVLLDARKVNIMFCNGCKRYAYCSKDCQRQAWIAYHKLECKMFNSSAYKMNPILKDNCNERTLYRLLCALAMSSIPPANVDELDRLKSDVKSSSVLKGGTFEAKAAQAKFATKSELKIEKIRKLYSTIMFNCASLVDSGQVPVCQGLDVIFSLMNHACDANSHYFIEGRNLFVRTIKPVKKGEELTVPYIMCYSQRKTVEERQKMLKDAYRFDCQCKRCRHELQQLAERDADQILHDKKLKSAQSILELMEASTTPSTADELRVFEVEMGMLQRRVYPSTEWPDHVKPMPDILMKLCLANTHLGRDIRGFKFLLKCSYAFIDGTKPVIDTEWVGALQRITLGFDKNMSNVLAHTAIGRQFPLDPVHTCIVYHGFLALLVRDACKLYGKYSMLARFNRAKLEAWEKNMERRPFDFTNRREQITFKKYQKILLEWADIPVERMIKIG